MAKDTRNRWANIDHGGKAAKKPKRTKKKASDQTDTDSLDGAYTTIAEPTSTVENNPEESP